MTGVTEVKFRNDRTGPKAFGVMLLVMAAAGAALSLWAVVEVAKLVFGA